MVIHSVIVACTFSLSNGYRYVRCQGLNPALEFKIFSHAFKNCNSYIEYKRISSSTHTYVQAWTLQRTLRVFASVPNFTIFCNVTIFRFKLAKLKKFSLSRFFASDKQDWQILRFKPFLFAFALCCSLHSLLSC